VAHRRSGFAKKIETVHWTLAQDSVIGLSSGNAAKTVLTAQHLPETLLRIRGEWAGVFSGNLGDNRGVAVAAGLILVPEGTGTTVLWSPILDGDAPWIWWDVFNLMYQEAVTDVVSSQGTLSRARVMDSKAMRKSRNMELQWVVENATITGLTGNAVNVSMSARVLAGS